MLAHLNRQVLFWEQKSRVFVYDVFLCSQISEVEINIFRLALFTTTREYLHVGAKYQQSGECDAVSYCCEFSSSF